MTYDKAVNIIRNVLHTYAENELGNKIGHGYCTKEDDLYEEEWYDISRAFWLLRKGKQHD
jgi:hypothetical protein|tara:strand:+ start:228 stop:407 length:180 start_codon:yes stop_codon:yes gene_type:complete